MDKCPEGRNWQGRVSSLRSSLLEYFLQAPFCRACSRLPIPGPRMVRAENDGHRVWKLEKEGSENGSVLFEWLGRGTLRSVCHSL